MNGSPLEHADVCESLKKNSSLNKNITIVFRWQVSKYNQFILSNFLKLGGILISKPADFLNPIAIIIIISGTLLL